MYNAEGELLKPLILHSGEASGFIVSHYERMKFQFCKTPDGMLTRTALCLAYDTIYKFAHSLHLFTDSYTCTWFDNFTVINSIVHFCIKITASSLITICSTCLWFTWVPQCLKPLDFFCGNNAWKLISCLRRFLRISTVTFVQSIWVSQRSWHLDFNTLLIRCKYVRIFVTSVSFLRICMQH